MPFNKDVHSFASSMYCSPHDGPWCFIVDKGQVETDYHQATADDMCTKKAPQVCQHHEMQQG